jgi:methionine-rich copper-binding protein CopC
VLGSAPRAVRVSFDAALEPAFSSLRVENSRGTPVESGQARVTGEDDRELVVDLAERLPAGKYHVFWAAVSRDGHRTEGDYSFTVR